METALAALSTRAAKYMNRVEDLAQLREQLKVWMDDAPVDRKAALIAQYRATLAEIDELSPKEESGDTIDEIAARRAARRPSPTPDKSRTKLTS